MPHEQRDLPNSARTAALVLLAVTLACAFVAQAHFALAREADTDEPLWHRTAALIWWALAAAATVALCRRTRSWRVPVWAGRWRWLAALAALVCLAGGLRVYRLAELPPGLWVDEALNGVQAVQIAASGKPLVALPEEDVRTGVGAGYVDVAALAFALFDPADGPYALRAVTAAIGTLGVATLAALAWMLYGPRAALAATAWMTVSQWHLNYSRWGEMPIMSSVVETLLALGLVIGARSRGWRSWVGFLLAGACAGVGVYSYQTFRLFAVLAALAGIGLALRRASALPIYWRPAIAALLLALLVAAPMLRYAAAAPEQFGERAQGTLIFGREDWRQQLAESIPRSLLAFHFIGDDNPRHNLPYAPLLSFVPALLAPVGLVVCLMRRRTLADTVVPLWLTITLVPGMVTLEAPHASRLLDAVVPLALLVGVGADFLLGLLQAALPGRGGVVGAAAVAVLAATAMAIAEYRAYFVERERRLEFVDAFFPWESAPARYLAAHAPNATVYLDPTTYWNPATQFVARRYLDTLPNDVRVLRLQHDFPPVDPVWRDALYLLPRPYTPVADVIRALWPEAQCEPTRDAFNRVEMMACRVPQTALADLSARQAAGTVRWRYGLRGRFYASADGDAPAAAEGMLAFPFIEYGLDEPPLGHFKRAEWDGFIDLPESGEYMFRLHPDSTTLVIDGQRIVAHAGARAFGGGNEGHAVLAQGRRRIRITLEPEPDGRYFLWFFWQPPHGDVAIVPSYALHPPRESEAPQ